MLAGKVYELAQYFFLACPDEVSVDSDKIYALLVSLIGVAGVNSDDVFVNAAANLMARFPSEEYPMAGDINTEGPPHVTLAPPYDPMVPDPHMCQLVQRYNATSGMHHGLIVNQLYFVFSPNLELAKLILALVPGRETHAKSLVKTLAKKWPPPDRETFRKLGEVLRPVVKEWDALRNQKPVKRPSDRKALVTKCLSGRLIGRCAGGDMSGTLPNKTFTSCPTCQEVQEMFKNVTGLDCPGFYPKRAPEPLSSGQRFVFRHLPEGTDCPLCQVPHSTANNNVLNVVWNKKSKKVYLRCFDTEASDNGWYCRIG